jgi:4-hydroxybenzoate polyprenyltransferase
MSDRQHDPFVGIAGAIGGISVAIVAIIAVFAKEQLAVAAWVVGALAFMGVCLGAMAAKGRKE